jgi:hypothetical protein
LLLLLLLFAGFPAVPTSFGINVVGLSVFVALVGAAVGDYTTRLKQHCQDY